MIFLDMTQWSNMIRDNITIVLIVVVVLTPIITVIIGEAKHRGYFLALYSKDYLTMIKTPRGIFTIYLGISAIIFSIALVFPMIIWVASIISIMYILHRLTQKLISQKSNIEED